MQIGRRVEVWVLGAALLASGEFSYAHLRQVVLWPLEIVSSALWRMLAARLEASCLQGSFWLAPLGLAAVALLAGALSRRRRRRTAADAEGGPHHG